MNKHLSVMKNKQYAILIFAMLTMVISSCEKFLDVNQNENDPVVVPESVLLPNAQKVLADGLNQGDGFSNGLSVYTHQMTTREEPDQYGITGTDFYLDQGWNLLFNNSLPDLDVIITQGP